MLTKTGKYVARPLVASSSEAEISGVVLQALLENLRTEETYTFLKKYNLQTIDPAKWYPQQIILDFYAAIISAKINASENIVALGMKFAETMPISVEARTIASAVTSLGQLLNIMIRNTPEEETVYVTETRPGYCRVLVNMPYPKDLLYGCLWSIARRFRPPQTAFSVYVVENLTPEETPGTAYDIIWG